LLSTLLSTIQDSNNISIYVKTSPTKKTVPANQLPPHHLIQDIRTLASATSCAKHAGLSPKAEAGVAVPGSGTWNHK